MTRLLLVRHGETVDNVNKIMQGQTHGRLTLNGIEQAHELGRQLRGEHIDVFLSSDLARAVETLEIIKKETHPQTPPVKGKTHPQTPPIREGSEMPLGGSSSQSEKVSTPLPYGRGKGEGLLPYGRGRGVGLLGVGLYSLFNCTVKCRISGASHSMATPRVISLRRS